RRCDAPGATAGGAVNGSAPASAPSAAFAAPSRAEYHRVPERRTSIEGGSHGTAPSADIRRGGDAHGADPIRRIGHGGAPADPRHERDRGLRGRTGRLRILAQAPWVLRVPG